MRTIMEVSSSHGPPEADRPSPGAGGPTVPALAVPGFDAVARMVVRSLDVSLVSLILNGGTAYWFAADAADAHAPHLLNPIYLDAARSGASQVVLDVRADRLFGSTPPLDDETPPSVRFFASEPVFTLDGQLIGALCVMGRDARAELDEAGRTALRDAAALAGAGVVLRSYIGRTDPVTGLPHRNAFFEDLRARQHNGDRLAALVAIELAPVERFNAFVRAMGHAYAEELVRVVADRVGRWMPPDTHLYQVGVTRFAAVLPGTSGRISSERLDELVARLRQPFDCLGIPLTIQPGVGLLDMDIRELDGGDPLRLVMSASHAAQRSVRGWARYERSQDDEHRREFFLVTELAAALSEGTELHLHYQPRVSLVTGRCLAVEALARWNHPTLGTIPPGLFIGLAERSGLMRSLTEWVLDQSIAQLSRWRARGHDIGLSINVSNADFGADLVTRLETAAVRHGVDPRGLELEFTESTLMHHSDATRRHLEAIRALGAGIAIDDFGTGYSNLTSLRQMPATSLKIDQSFVRSIHANQHDAAIVRSVADLAHDLGFAVVVEGVETRMVFDAVRDMACDEVQGYYISRPIPAAGVDDWLRQHLASGLPPDSTS